MFKIFITAWLIPMIVQGLLLTLFWNIIMPPIFHLVYLDFFQSCGLILLFRVLRGIAHH